MKIVQAFSMWDFGGTFGGAGFPPAAPDDPLFGVFNEQGQAVKYEPMIPPDEPPFKRLTAADRKARVHHRTPEGITLGYGCTSRDYWVQAVSEVNGHTVRGPAINYTLNDADDRSRAEREALACFRKEFAHVEAGAAIAGTYAAGAKAETIRLAMCEKCGHALLLHQDYSGCKHESDGLCHCMEGCKPPPAAAAPRERPAWGFPKGAIPSRSAAMQEAVAEGATNELRIKEGFVNAQRLGIVRILEGMGCPREIAAMISAGCSFTENQPDPALRGKWAYIAGPMRGKADFNFPEFDRARDALLANGWSVISPADIDRGDKGEPNPVERTHLYALRDFWCIYLLSQWGEGNTENQQFICFLDGWEHSAGAAAEAFLARWLSLRPLRVESKLVAKPITERPWVNIVREFAAPVV